MTESTQKAIIDYYGATESLHAFAVSREEKTAQTGKGKQVSLRSSKTNEHLAELLMGCTGLNRIDRT